MGEYIQAVGAAIIIGALADMLIPQGEFQKYCRLVCGFIVLATVLSPITGGVPEFTPESYIDTEAAQIEARARILNSHRENLVKIIENEFGGSRAYVEVDDEGNVTKVTVENAEDEKAVREYIRENMGEECEIKINENKGASDR